MTNNPLVKKRTGFLSSLAGPEMKMFWIFLPVLCATVAINIYFIPAAPFLIVSAVLMVAAGFIVFMYGLSSARRNVDIKLEREQFESIVTGLADALIVYDKDFRVMFFNPAAERLFRIRKEQVVGRIIEPQDAEHDASRLLAQVVFPSLAPVVVNRSDPSVQPAVADVTLSDPALELRVTTARVPGNAGETIGFMKIVRDRTREVELTKSKYEFITVASHQLKSPLTNILWALDALGKDSALSEESGGLVDNASSAGRLMLGIVEGLIAVSKIEEGRFGYTFQSMDIVGLVEKIVAEAVPQAKRVGIKIYLDKPKEIPPPVVMDPDKITMALQNLIENAVRYNVKNGEVKIRVEPEKGAPFVRVSVRDTGIGIPAEDSEKIFTKFFRGGNASRFSTEGSGLGLYIANNIVRAHGGKMWFETEANRGTTFHFTLSTDPAHVPQKEVPLEY